MGKINSNIRSCKKYALVRTLRKKNENKSKKKRRVRKASFTVFSIPFALKF